MTNWRVKLLTIAKRTLPTEARRWRWMPGEEGKKRRLFIQSPGGRIYRVVGSPTSRLPGITLQPYRLQDEANQQTKTPNGSQS